MKEGKNAEKYIKRFKSEYRETGKACDRRAEARIDCLPLSLRSAASGHRSVSLSPLAPRVPLQVWRIPYLQCFLKNKLCIPYTPHPSAA